MSTNVAGTDVDGTAEPEAGSGGYSGEFGEPRLPGQQPPQIEEAAEEHPPGEKKPTIKPDNWQNGLLPENELP
jgi:hypothetical protein